jgi:Ca2+-binding EF-hand superfamily protein
MHPLVLRGIAKLELEAQEELMEAYELFDNRNTGFIDATSLGEGMASLGFQAEQAQVQQMIGVLDPKNTGVIPKEEFKKFMTARMVHSAARRITGTRQKK